MACTFKQRFPVTCMQNCTENVSWRFTWLAVVEKRLMTHPRMGAQGSFSQFHQVTLSTMLQGIATTTASPQSLAVLPHDDRLQQHMVLQQIRIRATVGALLFAKNVETATDVFNHVQVWSWPPILLFWMGQIGKQIRNYWERL